MIIKKKIFVNDTYIVYIFQFKRNPRDSFLFLHRTFLLHLTRRLKTSILFFRIELRFRRGAAAKTIFTSGSIAAVVLPVVSPTYEITTVFDFLLRRFLPL